LWLCISDFNPNARKPQGSGNQPNIIAFEPINKRAPAPRVIPNYTIYESVDGSYNGAWTLINRNDRKKATFTKEDSVKQGIQLGLICSRTRGGKSVNVRGFRYFCPNHGIPVKGFSPAGRTLRTGYLLRTAPNVEVRLDGTIVYTAASRPRRVNASGILRTPKLAIRAGNGVEEIRVRANMSLKVGDTLTFFDRAAAKLPVNITEVDSNLGISAWVRATPRRPASAVQVVRPCNMPKYDD
jgi:hypothetical protein